MFFFGLITWVLTFRAGAGICFFIIYPYFFISKWIPVAIVYAPFFTVKATYFSLITNLPIFVFGTFSALKFSVFLIYFILKIIFFHPLYSLMNLFILFYLYFVLFLYLLYYKLLLLSKFFYLFIVVYDLKTKFLTIMFIGQFILIKLFHIIWLPIWHFVDSYIYSLLADISSAFVKDYADMHSINFFCKFADEFLPRLESDRDWVLNLINFYLQDDPRFNWWRQQLFYWSHFPYERFVFFIIKFLLSKNFVQFISWYLDFTWYFFLFFFIGIITALFYPWTRNPDNIHCNFWYNVTWRFLFCCVLVWFSTECVVFFTDPDILLRGDLGGSITRYRNVNYSKIHSTYEFFKLILVDSASFNRDTLVFLFIASFIIKKNYHNNIIYFIFHTYFLSYYVSIYFGFGLRITKERFYFFFLSAIDKCVQYYLVMFSPNKLFYLLTWFDFFYILLLLFVILYIIYVLYLVVQCWPIFYKTVLRPSVKKFARNPRLMSAFTGRPSTDEDDDVERIMESELNSWLGVVLRRSGVENKKEWDEFVEIDAFIIHLYLTAWTFAYEEKLRRAESYIIKNLDLTRIWCPVFDSTKFKYPPIPDEEIIIMIRAKIYELGEETFYKLSVNEYINLFVPDYLLDISDVKYYDITNDLQRNMNDSMLTWDEERHPRHFGCNLLRITGQGFCEKIQSFTYEDYGRIFRRIMIFRILYGETGYVEKPTVIINELFPIHEHLSSIECFCEQDEIELKKYIKEMNSISSMYSFWYGINIDWNFISGITTKSPKFKPGVLEYEMMLECKTNFEKEREGHLRLPWQITQEVSVRAFIPTEKEARVAPWLFIGGLWYRTDNYYGISTIITNWEMIIGKDKIFILKYAETYRQLYILDKTSFYSMNIWIRKAIYFKAEILVVLIQEEPLHLRREVISRTEEEWEDWQNKIFTVDSFTNFYLVSKKEDWIVSFKPIRYDKLEDFDFNYYDGPVPDPREKIYKKAQKKSSRK